MPRTTRASVGGVGYHVLNRRNARNDVFDEEENFQAFMKLIGDACERLPGWCLLSNTYFLGSA